MALITQRHYNTIQWSNRKISIALIPFGKFQPTRQQNIVF